MMTLNAMHLADSIPTIIELLYSTISKFITLAANDCGYEGTTQDIIVNNVHPLFLKAKAAASQEDNPNLRQDMNGKFLGNYWEAAVIEIETLESMRAWEVVEQESEGLKIGGLLRGQQPQPLWKPGEIREAYITKTGHKKFDLASEVKVIGG